MEPLFPPPTFPRNDVFTFVTFQAFQIKTGVTADLVRREEKEEQTSQKKQEDKEVARQLHPGESKSGCVASKSLTVQTILNFLVVNIESRRGSLLEGGLVEFCAGDKGQVGGSGSGFLGAESCLEHHGSLEECPGFLYSAVVLLVSIKFRFILGYSSVVHNVVVSSVQRLRRRRGRGRVFQGVLHSLPPL